MISNKNAVRIGIAALALIFAFARFAGCGRAVRPEAMAINDAYLAALAAGAAETAAGGEKGGQVVALLPEREGTGRARDRALASLLEKALQNAGFDRVELRWLNADQLGFRGGVQAEAFEEALRSSSGARALISLAGAPLAPPARVAAARGNIRIVIVEEDETPDSDRAGPLLAAKAAAAVIRPRGALAADAGRDGGSPIETFRRLFEVQTP